MERLFQQSRTRRKVPSSCARLDQGICYEVTGVQLTCPGRLYKILVSPTVDETKNTLRRTGPRHREISKMLLKMLARIVPVSGVPTYMRLRYCKYICHGGAKTASRFMVNSESSREPRKCQDSWSMFCKTTKEVVHRAISPILYSMESPDFREANVHSLVLLAIIPTSTLGQDAGNAERGRLSPSTPGGGNRETKFRRQEYRRRTEQHYKDPRGHLWEQQWGSV